MDNLQTILQGLSQEEQAAVIKILTEQSQTGSSVSYSNLIGADYDEIPVSIQEFIESPKYARNYIQTYYPFWKEQLINIFDRGKHYSEIAFTGSIGTGKAQPENAMILGQNGYFRMGDAKVGMKVFGEDGKLHNIVKVWPQGEQPVYKITFNDGTSVECEEDHLWNIRRAGFDSKQRVHLIAEGKGWETKSVRWLLTQKLWVNSDKKDSKGYRQAQRQFYIPITKPLEFENDYELPIHPYLLGQLIAEGSLTSDISVSIYEQDIREKVNSLLLPYGCYLKVGPEGNEGACEIHLKDYDRTKNMIHPIKKIIKELNLNVTAMNKHIPKMYLYSTVENRIQLLQGLFDGDGCIQDGQYTYSTSSEQLYKDITFLIESLGGSVYLREGKDSWYTVKDERIYTGNKNWEFYFKFPKSIIPFTSKKHSKRFGKGSKFDRTYIFRFIDKIEYVGRKNCLCITTDNPEGLYLTEHCIVTHNSSMAIVGMAYELYKLMCLKNPQKYWGTNKTIFFAFFNNNLDLARSVGFAAFHDLVKKSEWFLDHGEFRGKVHQVYHPYKDIELMAGSLPSHVIGKDVFCALQDEINFCLSEDTLVYTSKGPKKIRDVSSIDIVYGYNGNEMEPEISKGGIPTKFVSDYIEIELEDGTILKCSCNHKFMLIDGTYKSAEDLTEEDELLEYEPYGYIYITTNKLNGRRYIGQHRGLFDRNYLGSGDILHIAISKYGKDNFEVEVIDWARTADELDTKEAHWIKLYDAVNSSHFYNVAHTAYPPNVLNCIYMHKGDKRVLVKPSQVEHYIDNGYEHGTGLGPSNKGKLYVHRDGEILQIDVKDKAKYEEMGWNIPRPNEGKVVINNGVNLKYIKLSEAQDYINSGWEFGNHINRGKAGNVWMTDGDVDIFVSKESINKYEEKGFYRGRNYYKTHMYVHKENNYFMIPCLDWPKYEADGYSKGKGISNANGTCWVRKGEELKRIPKYDKDLYLNAGWEPHSYFEGKCKIWHPELGKFKNVEPEEVDSYLEKGWTYNPQTRCKGAIAYENLKNSKKT